MLQIKNFSVLLNDQKIVSDLSLSVDNGTLHVIMGPNGSGKSTLARALAGHSDYTCDGQVLLDDKNLLELPAHERARAGLFVAFQYPIEIPGISVMNFLKASVNAHRQAQALPPLDAADLLEKTKEQLVHVGLTPDFLYRSLNSGFSGGEKKRCELLQLALLQPKVAILDETDSGLDLDAFKMMADCINKMRNKHRSFIIITHYEQLVATLQPDFLHIFKSGNITHTGGQQLLEQLINNGYKSFNDSKG